MYVVAIVEASRLRSAELLATSALFGPPRAEIVCVPGLVGTGL